MGRRDYIRLSGPYVKGHATIDVEEGLYNETTENAGFGTLRVLYVRTYGTRVEFRGCWKSSPSKAAASEKVRRTLRYVESLSDARMLLESFCNIL